MNFKKLNVEHRVTPLNSVKMLRDFCAVTYLSGHCSFNLKLYAKIVFLNTIGQRIS